MVYVQKGVLCHFFKGKSLSKMFYKRPRLNYIHMMTYPYDGTLWHPYDWILQCFQRKLDDMRKMPIVQYKAKKAGHNIIIWMIISPL